MPFQPHYRLVTKFALGNSGSPKETASCSLSFSREAVSTAGTRQTAANDCFVDWATWVSSSSSAVLNTVKLTDVTLYSIGTDGKIDQDPAIAVGTPVSGAVGSNRHPWQCSMVLTLVAGARGKGRFGRIYLPPQSYQIDDDGGLAATDFNYIWTAAKTLMTSLSNKPGFDAGWGLAVAGGTGVAGTLRPVTELRMGRIADTQRRRRRSLAEAYAVQAFSA